MKQKEFWTIVLVAAIVGVIASVATASLMSNPALSPYTNIAKAINANSCSADQECEMDSGKVLFDFTVGKDISARDITAGMNVEAGSRVYAEMDILAGGDLVSGNMAGVGTAYVCADSEGKLYRSNFTCR